MSALHGVPSVHYAPAFALRVREALATFRPTAIALEAPPESRALFEMACAAWPTPVAGIVGRLVLPFVPGDSLLEAYRLGRAASVAIHLVDPLVHRRRERSGTLPSSALAGRMGRAYDALADALATSSPPQPADLAREATMARALTTLLRAGERVLWVGGMAHWRRIATRVVQGDFAAPPARPIEWREPERVRLAGDALLALTGRCPWTLRRWVENPEQWDERDAMRTLALAAVEVGRFADVTLVGPGVDDEPPTPADVAKVLTYARNLAATSRVADCPSVRELVQAASAVVGRRYAGRVLALATEDAPSAVTLPALTLGPTAFRLGTRRPRLVPGWGAPPEAVPFVLRRTPRRLAAMFDDLPEATDGEPKAWQCWPPDEEDYEAFVRHVLRRASMPDRDAATTLPFRAGLRDGLDVRTTLRRWHEGTIFVREDRATPVRVTNGIIDWAHASEDDPHLQRPRRVMLAQWIAIAAQDGARAEPAPGNAFSRPGASSQDARSRGARR